MIEALSMSSYYLEEIKYNLVSMFNQKKKKRSPAFDQELLEAFK